MRLSVAKTRIQNGRRKRKDYKCTKLFVVFKCFSQVSSKWNYAEYDLRLCGPSTEHSYKRTDMPTHTLARETKRTLGGGGNQRDQRYFSLGIKLYLVLPRVDYIINASHVSPRRSFVRRCFARRCQPCLQPCSLKKGIREEKGK